MSDSGYELIDFGGGYRLERFGDYILERPSLAAADFCKENKLWDKIDSSFLPESSSEGQRGKWTVTIDSWRMELEQVRVMLELRCTPFGHVGFFAEHVTNWQELSQTIAEELKQRDTVRVLNLFAYTGGASIVAAKSLPTTITTTTTKNPEIEIRKRLEVVHVDSANNIVGWAKRNAELNNVSGVRFIAEDARKFVARELRRGNFYDVVILDPPTYGHGVRGETWRIAIDLPKLLSDIIGLLSERPIMIILTTHTEAFDPDILSKMLLNAGIPKSLKIKKSQMQIKTKTEKPLPSGYAAIASIYNLYRSR
ncbi:MAG: class I SAM-dependent methyltransferase [Planctomycetaceae bacterium]|jgi:23S rRNA (cytosine1962-C5)-methyltransferase|nr:class I SAM-dependent methyltransferase [Planctomycetaceae bacterium]